MTTTCRVSRVECKAQRKHDASLTSLTRPTGPTPPGTFSQPATFNLQPATASFLTGHLTPPDGLPDGSNFCKSLKSRNVDGLTGKIPPGSHLCPTSPTRPTRPTPSKLVKPSPTKSNQIQPGPLYTPHPTLGQ
jgi:hypothetical protein